MQAKKWVGLLVLLMLIIAAFLPWVTIESKPLTITGINTTGTNWGKPASLHFVLGGIYFVLSLMPFVWAKRANVLIAGVNLGWAMRNFIILALCEGGECPVRRIGLYLVVVASVSLFIASLFPDVKIIQDEEDVMIE